MTSNSIELVDHLFYYGILFVACRIPPVAAEDQCPTSRSSPTCDRPVTNRRPSKSSSTVWLTASDMQTLLGVTGSGKTFTMANIVEQVNRPTLVLAHNKTLAAQLYSEFKEFFPSNAVEYFVSYYDYYQPEAYVPRTDTYIEKDADINEEIDKLRHAATRSLLTRRDTLIVASVSCIYGLGSPEEYQNTVVSTPRRRSDQARQGHAPPDRHPVRPQRHDARPRHLPRPRRHPRDLSGLRGDRGPGRVLRRRDRAHRRGRPADRRAAGRAARGRHLPGQALRHHRRQARGRDHGHPGRSSTSAWQSSRPRARSSKPRGSSSARCTTWR